MHEDTGAGMYAQMAAEYLREADALEWSDALVAEVADECEELMTNDRITWIHGETREGPRELIGVLELRGDDGFRAVFAERVEVDGKCHILLAKQAWGPKDAIDTRWWSLVLDANHKAYSVRTGSCGDPLLKTDVPRVTHALEELGLLTEHTMLHLADGPAAFPGRAQLSAASV